MWRYTSVVLGVWLFNPELRRLYDWRFGYSQVELISLLPLLSLVPYVWSLLFSAGWRRLPLFVTLAAYLWLSAFSYGLLIAIFNGNLISGLYSFVIYVFPIAIGLWVCANEANLRQKYFRVSRVVFSLTTAASVYGIVQFVIAPPWDVLWLQNKIAEHSLAFGLPIPFAIRVFSVLNDPATFACLIVFTLLLALPELAAGRLILLLQLPVWLVAITLTLVRTSWLMLSIGLVIYFIVSGQQLRIVAALIITATLVAALLPTLSDYVGSTAFLSTLTTRVESFSDLDSDLSKRARDQEYAEGFALIMSAPLGRGLGVVGTATELGNAGASTISLVIDSGVLGRTIELGIPGALMLVASLAAIISGLFPLLGHASRDIMAPCNKLAGVALSAVVAFLFLESSIDGYGLFFLLPWLIVGLAGSMLRDKSGALLASSPA